MKHEYLSGVSIPSSWRVGFLDFRSSQYDNRRKQRLLELAQNDTLPKSRFVRQKGCSCPQTLAEMLSKRSLLAAKENQEHRRPMKDRGIERRGQRSLLLASSGVLGS